MKRTSLFVALALAAVFAAALVKVNQASNQPAFDVHAIHNHGQDQHAQHQPNSQQKQAIVDGAVTPDAIPDHVAEGIVMSILASEEPDKIGDRKKAYLRHYGFDEDAQAALMLAAREYKRLVEPIDRDVNDVKNRNWPNPGSSAWARLNELKRDKRAAIANVMSELNGRLQTYGSLDKWTNHISNTVKRKIKGFASELPTKKIGFFRLFPDPFATYAQAGGCDPTYVSADGVYYEGSTVVYGYGAAWAEANNCGHDFSTSLQITHAGAPTVYGSDFAVFDLSNGSSFHDGNFFIYTNAQGFCPVISQTFLAGSASDMEMVAPFLTVNPFGNFSPTSITEGGQANIALSVIASQNANGSFNAELSYGLVQGNAPINASIIGSGNHGISGGNTVPVSALYKMVSITSNPTKIKAVAVITSSITVKNGNQTSASILTITK